VAAQGPSTESAEARLELRDLLWDQAQRQFAEGRFAQAAEAGEMVLAIERRWLGDSHEDVIQSIEWLAAVYQRNENWPDAETRWKEAVDWREKYQGREHWQTADARLALEKLRRVAKLSAEARQEFVAALTAGQQVVRLYNAGQFAEAFVPAQDVATTMKKILGEQSRDYAASLFYLAAIYQKTGDFARAESLYCQALEIAKTTLGEQHPECATYLQSLALLYYSQGDYARAEPLLQQALKIRKNALGEQHPDFAMSLSHLAALYFQRGDYARAEVLYQQTLEIRKKVLGETHPDYATSLNNLAVLYYTLGDYARAVPLYRRALDVTKSALGDQHPEYATSLNNLAEVYRSMGDYAQAEPLCRQALEIRRNVLGEQHPDFASSLNNLALLCYMRGDYAQAEPLYRQALEITKSILGETHPDYARDLQNLALLYHKRGDYARAEPMYRQALEICKEVLGDRHPEYATSLNCLAGMYSSMGDYARALPLYRRALEITKTALGEQHPDYATSLNSLADVYGKMGDYARAEPLYRQAAEIQKTALGTTHPDYATTLNNLAAVYEIVGDYARAEPLYREALEITKMALGETHPDYAASLNNLAVLFHAQGDYAQAEPLYRQTLEIRQKALGEQHPDYAASLNNLALLLHMRGDYAEAEPRCRQALEIRKELLGEHHPEYAASLHSLAELRRSKGDYDHAAPLYRQAFEIVITLIDATATAQDQAGQLRMAQSAWTYLDPYLSCLLQQDNAAEAYLAVLRWKGRTLVRQRAARLAPENEEVGLLLSELQSVVREWIALATGVPPNDPAWKGRFAELTRRKEQLEAELSRRSSVGGAATAEITIEDLQRALPSGAVLVDFFEYWWSAPALDRPGTFDVRRSLIAFVVRPDRPVEMFDLGAVEPIAAAIDVWRGDYGKSADARQAGALLRSRLWAPLVEAVGDAKLMLISPDGALGKLPFAALPGAAPDAYLIEDVPLALVPTPQLIPAMAQDAERRERTTELVVVGGVDYDRRADVATPADVAPPRRPWERGLTRAVEQRAIVGGMSWPFLSGTESEAAYVASLYQRLMGLSPGSKSVAFLRGAEATEEAFRQAAPNCYLLHIATHGFFAAEDKPSASETAAPPREGPRASPFGDRLGAVRGHSPGLLSGLVLAGANNPPEIPDDPALFAATPDDGYLTADEIAFLPMVGTRLVVMSACESGLGETAGGEGLLGIQRAFQVAGVRTTIATLWKVNDEATRRIMEEFYRNYLEREMSPHMALRAAQLWAINNPELIARGADPPADETNAHRLPPKYWAAFTVSGDWR
jgi:tetratricopeptide (TPR) repeat protein/CHAT domain-containing protein